MSKVLAYRVRCDDFSVTIKGRNHPLYKDDLLIFDLDGEILTMMNIYGCWISGLNEPSPSYQTKSPIQQGYGYVGVRYSYLDDFCEDISISWNRDIKLNYILI